MTAIEELEKLVVSAETTHHIAGEIAHHLRVYLKSPYIIKEPKIPEITGRIPVSEFLANVRIMQTTGLLEKIEVDRSKWNGANLFFTQKALDLYHSLEKERYFH